MLEMTTHKMPLIVFLLPRLARKGGGGGEGGRGGGWGVGGGLSLSRSRCRNRLWGPSALSDVFITAAAV